MAATQNPTTAAQAALQQALAGTRVHSSKIANLENAISEIKSLLRQTYDAPKFIEDIPGKRSPYFAPIDITVAASSTSKVEGTYSVSTDGPFCIVAIGLFWQRTSSPYNGMWAPASTLEAKIAPASQGLGFQNLFDSPLMGSFDVEFAESGADRNWQSNAFASALFSPSVGGVYVLPVTALIGRASIVTARVTPTVAQDVAGKVQVLLCGYKIVQGDTYQP
jgi:hypothetical protein